MDPRLEKEYSINEARKIGRLADNCLSKSSKDRPKMSQVVERLKQIVQVSNEGDSFDKTFEEICEEDPVEAQTKQKQHEPSEAWKRRMAHLAKLGEHVEGASRRRLLIMQRAKVV
ncbi:hypothetical protein CUMW_182840 [Citrus unshiu]|nr:hypothetical protein CUMW_182840 [Citrus unshiu]